MSDIFLIAALCVTVLVVKNVAERLGVGWGIASFVACAIMAGVVSANLGIDIEGGCVDYGPRAQAADYC